MLFYYYCFTFYNIYFVNSPQVLFDCIINNGFLLTCTIIYKMPALVGCILWAAPPLLKGISTFKNTFSYTLKGNSEFIEWSPVFSILISWQQWRAVIKSITCSSSIGPYLSCIMQTPHCFKNEHCVLTDLLTGLLTDYSWMLGGGGHSKWPL